MNQNEVDLGTALRVALRVHLEPAAETWQGFVACCLDLHLDPEGMLRSSRPRQLRPGEGLLDRRAALRALELPPASANDVQAWEQTFVALWTRSTQTGES